MLRSKVLILLPVLALITLLQGCSQCRVGCTSGCFLAAYGYTFGELNTIVMNTYQADGSFTHRISSAVIYNRDTTAQLLGWQNLNKSNDTTGDTMECIALQAGLMLNFDYGSSDIEVIIPSDNNRTFRFSKIVFDGAESEKQPCSTHGSNWVPGCSRHLTSYNLNGVTVTNSSAIFNQLSFQK